MCSFVAVDGIQKAKPPSQGMKPSLMLLSALCLAGCASRPGEFPVNPSVGAMKEATLAPTTQVRISSIKEQSQQEIEEASRLDGLRAYLRRSYPALRLESKDQLWETSVGFVTWLGLDVNSPQGAAKLENTLSSLIPTSKDASPSLWLFKATLRAGGNTTAPAKTVVYGIATMTRTNADVVIASHFRNNQFNFRGIAGAKLEGRSDFSDGTITFAGKTEGECSSEDISMSGQARVAGNLIHGTFILLR